MKTYDSFSLKPLQIKNDFILTEWLHNRLSWLQQLFPVKQISYAQNPGCLLPQLWQTDSF